MDNRAFKIETRDNWHENAKIGKYFGSALDKKDGFIHLSTIEQLGQTLSLYFAEVKNLIIAEIDADYYGDLMKWELSRGGALFPHLYGELVFESVRKIYEVEYNDGIAQIPMELRI